MNLISKNQTLTFKRDDSSKTILEGMELVEKEMKEKGLLTDAKTFEDMANYAGQHVLITEKKDDE